MAYDHEIVSESQQAVLFQRLPIYPLSHIPLQQRNLIDRSVVEEERDRAYSALALFIRLRFVDRACDRYIDWRASSGYQFRDFKELNTDNHLLDAIDIYFSPNSVNDLGSVEDLFRCCWHVGLTFDDGANLPVAIADCCNGHASWFGKQQDYSSCGLEPNLLSGRALARRRTLRSWFQRLDAIVQRARLLYVFEFANGVRRPLEFWMSLSESGEWGVDAILALDSLMRQTSGLEF